MQNYKEKNSTKMDTVNPFKINLKGKSINNNSNSKIIKVNMILMILMFLINLYKKKQGLLWKVLIKLILKKMKKMIIKINKTINKTMILIC